MGWGGEVVAMSIAVARFGNLPRRRAFRNARTFTRVLRPGRGGTRICLPVAVRACARSRS